MSRAGQSSIPYRRAAFTLRCFLTSHFWWAFERLLGDDDGSQLLLVQLNIHHNLLEHFPKTSITNIERLSTWEDLHHGCDTCISSFSIVTDPTDHVIVVVTTTETSSKTYVKRNEEPSSETSPTATPSPAATNLGPSGDTINCPIRFRICWLLLIRNTKWGSKVRLE